MITEEKDPVEGYFTDSLGPSNDCLAQDYVLGEQL